MKTNQKTLNTRQLYWLQLGCSLLAKLQLGCNPLFLKNKKVAPKLRHIVSKLRHISNPLFLKNKKVAPQLHQSPIYKYIYKYIWSYKFFIKNMPKHANRKIEEN